MGAVTGTSTLTTVTCSAVTGSSVLTTVTGSDVLTFSRKDNFWTLMSFFKSSIILTFSTIVELAFLSFIPRTQTKPLVSFLIRELGIFFLCMETDVPWDWTASGVWNINCFNTVVVPGF